MAGVSLRPKWPGARRDEGAYPQRSVTEEQRSPRPFSAQPSGPPVFSPPASWLAPHRPLAGMLVARAWREAQIPGGETPAICETPHQAGNAVAVAIPFAEGRAGCVNG